MLTDCGIKAAAWDHEPYTGLLRCQESGRCMAIAGAGENATIEMASCDKNDDRQVFSMTKFNHKKLAYRDLATPVKPR